MAVLSSLSLAFGQLGDPRIRKVLGLSIALTIGVYVLIAIFLAVGLSMVRLAEIGWLDSLLSWLGGAATFLLSLMLFPALASSVIGVFQDDVADAVEARHYPALPPPFRTPVIDGILSGLRFAGVAVLVNLLALPFYIFVPGIGQILFYAVNGYLVSREYWEVIALRRLDGPVSAALRRANMMRLWGWGAVVTFLLTIPFLNIVMPAIATAAMVHVVHRLGGTATASRSSDASFAP